MILITGAPGLVGSYLALQLAEKGFSIKAIHPENDPIQKTKDLFDLYNKGHLFSRISWVCADITDIPSLEIAFENVRAKFRSILVMKKYCEKSTSRERQIL
jgi:nucleoside-diphosphate-sugar epimerase